MKKIRLRPKTAQARSFGIVAELSLLFALRRVVWLRRIHPVTVAFVVPPRQTEIRRNHVFAGMHVTNHALRSRNAAGQLMLDRMTGLIFRNARVGRLRPAQVSRGVVEGRVPRVAIVGVNYMTRRAT